ncbi:MAG: hypothetical protein AAGA75_24775 [Cyanobacteria bacterium P01_E01_bin.6]
MMASYLLSHILRWLIGVEVRSHEKVPFDPDQGNRTGQCFGEGGGAAITFTKTLSGF